jgi:hypothetical protein
VEKNKDHKVLLETGADIRIAFARKKHSDNTMEGKFLSKYLKQVIFLVLKS